MTDHRWDERNHVIRPASEIAEGTVRACAVTILVLVAAVQLHAQDDDHWIGRRVVPKTRDFVLRIDDEPVEASRKAIAIYRVERVDGQSLWLEAEGQRLNGWADARDIIPIHQAAIGVFSDQIRAHPQDAFAYAMRALSRQAWYERLGERRAALPPDKQAAVPRGEDELAAAFQDYDQAIRLGPKNAALYCARGSARHAVKDYGHAIDDYDEAIRLDPKSALAYIGRGMSRGARKDYDRAIEDFNEGIWLDPLSLTAYGNRGLAWYFQKEYRKAIVDFDMILRLDPEHAITYNRRGLAWKNLKAYAKAVADYETAIRLDAEDSVAHDGLACIRAACPDAKFRDGRKAIASANRACELTFWKNPAYLATLAAAHAEAGDFDAAMTWQARAIALDPEAEDKSRGEKRLQLYRRKTPYREADPGP